jgi:hypothetical protein
LAETAIQKSRRTLLPRNKPRNDARPENVERRARLVSAIAKGRQWLDDVVSGRVTTVQEICIREMQRSAGQHDHLTRFPRAER